MSEEEKTERTGFDEKLKSHITWAEARRKFPYEDSVGKVTIGIGWNLDDRGLPEDIIDELYERAVREAENEARSFPWFDKLNDDRKLVIIDMVFNLGLTRFSGFVKTIEAIKANQFEVAATEMMDSKWARQTGRRAQLLAATMATGKYQRKWQ